MKKHAMLYETKENNAVHCFLCSHHCHIAESKFGFCNVRQNMKGKLYSHVYGALIARHVDPIEKKPLYHFLSGSKSYSIATPGCNFHCGFCQNWQISQFTAEKNQGILEKRVEPNEIILDAKKLNCESIAYTYTEPTIFFEFAYDTAVLAKKQNIHNIFVTNGYMTKQTIDKIAPYLDAANIDLKSFSNDFYKRMCKASLQPVLDSIQYMKQKGIWVEVTTLIVPDQNDSEKNLSGIADFISSVSTDIPWHISRFYPDYQYHDVSPTPVETLRKAKKLGKKHGLKHIHLGNI